MKKILLPLILISFLLVETSCISREAITPSGSITKKTIVVDSFTGIDVSSAIEVIFEQGKQNVVVETYQNIHDYVDISTQGGKLIIKTVPDISVRNHNIKVYVSSPDIKDIDTSGASVFAIKGELKVNNLAIDCSGASNIKGNITGNNLNVDLSGASHLNGEINFSKANFDFTGASRADLSGNVSSINIDLSGSSDIKAKNLETDYSMVNMSGASSTDIKVVKELSYNLSGASDLNYWGDPSIKKGSETSGGSKVRQK